MKNKNFIQQCWLLLILCQFIVGALFFRLGIKLDLMLFSNSAGGGHGIPFFSAVFFLIFVIIMIGIFILAMIFTIFDEK